MTEPQPKVSFQQINIVTSDWDATVAFYQTLGIDVPDVEGYPPGSDALHTEAGGIELDNEAGARNWHTGWAGGDRRTPIVVTFSLPTRDAVDATYAALVAAGHPGTQPPFDAFWGSRYAIVTDPNGIEVGLMSPRS